METSIPDENEVQPFSESEDERKIIDENDEELGEYGESYDDLSRNAYSSGSEDPIDEEGLADEFTEKCAIDSTQDHEKSSETSDIDVSDEVGSEPAEGDDDEEDETEEVVEEPEDDGPAEPEPLLDLSEVLQAIEPSPECCNGHTGGEGVCPVTGKTCGTTEDESPISDDTTPEPAEVDVDVEDQDQTEEVVEEQEPEPETELEEVSADDSEFVEVEGVDVENIEMALASSEDEELEIPKGEVPEEETSKKTKKPLTQKLHWEAKASIPKYAMVINSKLNKEDIQKSSITTKGKAEKIAQAKTEINQTKAKIVKEQFRKDVEIKRTADQIARAKIVEKERARVAEAKKKKDIAAEKIKKEAYERNRKEKEEKEKERTELEIKRMEFNRAKVEAIKSSRSGKQ